jgi:hypothetical protein
MTTKIDVLNRYSSEINKINDKLNQLENKRIYELSHAGMDGSLPHNISQLRDMITKLLNKIEQGEKSDSEIFSTYVEK